MRSNSLNDAESAKSYLRKRIAKTEKKYDQAMERRDHKAAVNLLKELEILDTLLEDVMESEQQGGGE